jgi:4-diphosphocytidyl-2-C-methyl-D-erythritol kinase
MTTRVRSHAKINLGLYVGAPRADGFHGLATVYQTLELFDVVTVTARPAATTTIHLTCNDTRVPTDARNTAWKMVERAMAHLEITAGVDVHIEKRLPVQGGMGAGSANAVAALVGLERELELGAFPPIDDKAVDGWGTQGDLSGRQCLAGAQGLPGLKIETGGTQGFWAAWERRMLDVAAKVGSDVPLFLVGGAVLGRDRGQVVEPLPDVEPVWCVVALPAIGVSTAQAFRDWDALCATEGLTQQASQDKLNELSRAFVSAFQGNSSGGEQETGSSGVPAVGGNLAGPQESALVRTGILTWVENDFERVVFPQHPSLAEIKRILAAAGTPEAALLAMLSGSGSALFGLYQTRGDAEAALGRLRAAGVEGQLTRTLPRQAYWSEVLLPELG